MACITRLVPIDLFELHGNSNVERCTKCKRRYLRDYRVRTSTSVKIHKTGEMTTVRACVRACVRVCDFKEISLCVCVTSRR